MRMRKGTEKEEVFAIAFAIAPRTPTGDEEDDKQPSGKPKG